MKSLRFPIFELKCVRYEVWMIFAGVVALLVIIAACSSEREPASLTPAAAPLSCPECQLVDVIGVVDANTLNTSIGEIQMYGAHVLDQPADCAEQAAARLSELSGSSVRIEPGPSDTIRNDPNHYYLYTEKGISIEEMLVREGLALVWGQDGQHLGWFLFRDADAKQSEAGCLWKGWNAFQRGEPSEFRIPGLTYPDSAQ